MTEKTRSHIDTLRGATRLAVEATKGITGLVEEMHRTIGGGPAVLGRPLSGPVRLMTAATYGGIRAATRLVGAGLDLALEQLSPLVGETAPGAERDAVLAALNGVLGDYLDETDNPLAIEMRLRPAPLAVEPSAGPTSSASQKLLVLVHGSCMNARQWNRNGHDHGAALARDLGYEAVYLQYNSGRHVSTNGAELAAQLERFVQARPTPVEELVILGHSMGGLVARSACHVAETAGLGWRQTLRAMVFLGTPHHGAPLERGGNWVDVLLGVSRYSAPLVRLGQIRSAGVTDLRFGNVLDAHWHGRDRFKPGADQRSPLPLPCDVACYAIAGTTGSGRVRAHFGDGIVPVASALGRHQKPELSLAFPETHTWTGEGIKHLDLLDHAEVYEVLRGWLEAS
ncbi:MAG: pimeloyl-ACP methyl ester carboxylesterase [Myxococcota bacterium]|jgi:pimeloyl-ACP methyl ester carboxylesterase